MANLNSGRHARKVTLDAAVSNAIAKAVDARKVARLRLALQAC